MMGLRIRIETFTGELNECRKQSTIIDKENGNLKRELEKKRNSWNEPKIKDFSLVGGLKSYLRSVSQLFDKGLKVTFEKSYCDVVKLMDNMLARIHPTTNGRATLPLSVGFFSEFLGHRKPTANVRFYPTVVGSWLFGFPLECGSYKSSIEFLQEEGDLRKILDPIQQSKEYSYQNGLARKFHSVARDVEELKKGKSSTIIEQRVGDNLGGFNSPHRQRPFDNASTYGYHNMPGDNDCQEGIVDKDESSKDQDIASFEVDKEGMSLVTIRALSSQVHEDETSVQKENIFHTKNLVEVLARMHPIADGKAILPSPVRFYLEFIGHWQPTADDRFYPIAAGQLTRTGCKFSIDEETTKTWAIEEKEKAEAKAKGQAKSSSMTKKEKGKVVSTERKGKGLSMSMDGHMPTQSHQEGLARQFQSVARVVEELKKGKSSATTEQKATRTVSKARAWHDYNFYEDNGDNPNISQAYHGGYYGIQQGDKALDKIKWKVPSFKGDSDPNVFFDWERQVENLFIVTNNSDIVKRIGPCALLRTVKQGMVDITLVEGEPDQSPSPKVEEKRKSITNSTRCFKCNRVGHIDINCPSKRTFVFGKDLNGWIGKSDDDCQERIVDKDDCQEGIVDKD
ncbi:hypothetical protein M9H77_03390 [Catharanthus roseus]|uniref:Uncharacterized protein n=1 Tax=Catharanthus roseus TaxID=4058 RepID=A0ACC0CB37_CATRO|nr:hypothetical protein M9H77_03390 [Catharanthus roseus]